MMERATKNKKNRAHAVRRREQLEGLTGVGHEPSRAVSKAPWKLRGSSVEAPWKLRGGSVYENSEHALKRCPY